MSRTPAATAHILSTIVDDVVNAMDLRSAFTLSHSYSGRPEADDKNDDDNEDDNDGDEEDNEDDDTGGTDDSSPDKDIKDPDKKRLSDEAAKYRNQAKQAAKERDKFAAELKKHEDGKKSENERLEGDLKAANEKVSKLEGQLKTNSVELAFFKSGAAAGFKSASTALRLLDLDGIEPDEDGEVDVEEIKKRADALGKKEAYLLKDGDEEDLGEDEGQPSGRSTNGKKKSKDDLTAAKLAQKYPALRDRV